jgi:hypothetical protein
MSEREPATFEIDHGEPVARRPVQPVAAVSEAEQAASARLRDARPLALAQIAKAGRAQQLVDMECLILAGLCGQGLSSLTCMETWSTAATAGMLLSLAGLGATGWMWRRTRQSAEIVLALPIPVDSSVVKRLAEQSEEHRLAEQRRQEEDLSQIELLSGDLDHQRHRLRLALFGALAGSLCGWLCGIFGPVGTPALAASAAALPGTVLGWRIAGGGWSPERIQRAVIGVLPVTAAVLALWCGTPILYVLAGAVAAAGAGLFWRQRLVQAAAQTAD